MCRRCSSQKGFPAEEAESGAGLSRPLSRRGVSSGLRRGWLPSSLSAEGVTAARAPSSLSGVTVKLPPLPPLTVRRGARPTGACAGAGAVAPLLDTELAAVAAAACVAALRATASASTALSPPMPPIASPGAAAAGCGEGTAEKPLLALLPRERGDSTRVPTVARRATVLTLPVVLLATVAAACCADRARLALVTSLVVRKRAPATRAARGRGGVVTSAGALPALVPLLLVLRVRVLTRLAELLLPRSRLALDLTLAWSGVTGRPRAKGMAVAVKEPVGSSSPAVEVPVKPSRSLCKLCREGTRR